jgi:hypothetical protein
MWTYTPQPQPRFQASLATEPNRTAAARPASGNELSQWLSAVLFALATLGYSVAGALTTIFNADSVLFNIPFRVLLVGVCVLLILVSVFKGGFALSASVVVFLVWYLGRLAYDMYYARLGELDRVLPFYISSVLLPALALSVAPDRYDEKRTAKVVLGVGVAACLLVQFINISGGFGGQLDLRATEGRLAFNALNPITISETGLFTMIAAYAVLRQRKGNLIAGHVALVALPLGMLTFIEGGSRGPLASLFACLMLIAIVARQLWLVVLMGAATAVVLLTMQVDSSPLFNRLSNIGQDESTMLRLYYQANSLDLGWQHPIFGYAYVDPLTYVYPHNLLIESFLALGVGGLVLMLWLQYRLVSLSFEFMRRGFSLLPLFAVEATVNAWSSGSLWGAGTFFVCLALLLAHWQRLKSLQRRPTAVLVAKRRGA